ncbi:MAG: sensor histidine kinase [Solibacillus sp.]
MIGLFLRQYKSWLILLLSLQLFINGLFYLDEGIEGISLLYFNLVWLTIISAFLSWRYTRDKKWIKQYETLTGNYYATMEWAYEEQHQELSLQLQEKNLIVLEKQDELLAWVHEMKSPLTAMQLIFGKMESSELKEKVENEWLRLFLLLDQQLHATRLMTIEQDNRLEKVMLQGIVVSEVKALRSWCFEKNLEMELEHLDIEIISDAKWLGFMIRQILSNAVKYSNDGGRIQLYTTTEKEQVILHIRDEGIGIASEDLPRVFRKSYTGTVGRETSAATGMGLYLAKQVANSLHIHLSIQSIRHQGTTTSIHFPKLNEYTKTLGM